MRNTFVFYFFIITLSVFSTIQLNAQIIPLSGMYNMIADNPADSAVSSTQATTPSFSVGVSFSTRLSLVRIIGLSLGGTARFYWRPSDFISIDFSFADRTLIGYDYSTELSCLFTIFRSGIWSFAVGPLIGFSYESKMVA
jgi:hypothetical protein